MATFGQILVSSKEGKKRKKESRSRVQQIRPLEIPVPPLKPVVEKTVYFRVGEHERGRMDWYVFKLSSNDPCSSSTSGGGRKRKRGGNRAAEKIEPILKKKTKWLSRCAALGSTIYCIGDGTSSFDVSPKVIATDDPLSGKWRKVAHMKAKRMRPHTVTADDKIYVFGGLCERGIEVPDIEVFDGKTWETVEKTPVSINYACGFFACYFDDAPFKKIICGSFSAKSLIAYHMTEGGTWNTLNSKFEFPFIFASQPTLLDYSLYWIYYNADGVVKLVSYDINLRIWQGTPILDFDHLSIDHDKYDLFDMTSFFHFRGNEFYFFWLDKMDIEGGKCCSLIRCSRILFSKNYDNQQSFSLEAYCLSSKTYQLPKCIKFMHAVVL